MASGSVRPEKIVRFGPFETNLHTGETRKYGIRIRLGGQPTQILTTLLERPGKVITREELRHQLWADDTFVEFENGLNNAVKKLRSALGDSADKPLYVETLPRVGYRFIAPIEPSADRAAANGGSSEAVEADSLPLPTKTRARMLRWGLGFSLAVLGVVLYGFLSPLPTPRVTGFLQTPLTDHFDGFGQIVTDGVRVYFLERSGDRDDVVETSTVGGPATKVDTPFRNTRIFNVSRDGSEFLIGNFVVRRSPLPLWTWPVQGGSPARVGDVVVDDAAWTPDGQQIVYARDGVIHLVRREGTGDRVLIRFVGFAHWIRFSPDGRSFVFTLVPPQSDSETLWEASADGSNPHIKFPSWSNPPSESGGDWTPDGKYFVFTSHHGGSPNLWAVREKVSLLHWKSSVPVQLTPTARAMAGAVLTRNGTRAFANAWNDTSEAVRYDPESRQFKAIPETRGLLSFRPSTDGVSAVLQKPDWTLWRTSNRGESPIQLTSPPLRAAQAQLSPDGTKIAFEAGMYGKPTRAYVVSAQGGPMREILAQEGEQGVPAWSPDGSQIAIAVNVEASGPANAPRGIYVVDSSTGKAEKVVGSDGLTSPMWSPDVKYFTAKTADETSILLFDSKAEKWNTIAKGTALSGLTWSRDSKYLFVQKIADAGQPIYRLHAGDFKEEPVVDFHSFLESGVETCVLQSAAADGSLIVRLKRSGGNVYALDLDLP
jgi:Tol biopolymer transport system component/DNA-binding winged helix-turn-helix (wHTH) protein